MTPKQFAQYLTDAGAEVRPYSYVYRTHYYAFDVPSFADALAIVADAAILAADDKEQFASCPCDHAEEFVTALKSARVDTLGRGLIVYFPTMEVQENER